MTQAAITPADRIIGRFGVEKIARWTGRHRSRVHAWAWAPDRGGTGGVVPPRLRQKIIEGARSELGEAVAFADFEPREGERYLAFSEPASVPDDVQ